jgi:RimJ/RimL family protein N-acetyltransferase
VTGVALVELDDVAAAELRGDRAPSRRFADGFPRREDREALRARERGAVSFLVTSDDVVVGTCGTHGPPGSDGAIELGWGLVPSARGRGIGGTAVALLLAEVRRRHPGTPIVAHTEWRGLDGAVAADSPPSEAILRRLGFVADPVPVEPGYRAWRLTAVSRTGVASRPPR